LGVYPTLIPNALDEEKSVIERFDDGRVMFIELAVFREEAIGGADILKLSMDRTGETYFSQRFVDLWMKSELKGLDFVQVNGVHYDDLWWSKPYRPKKKKRKR
jgi:hypothetical protein